MIIKLRFTDHKQLYLFKELEFCMEDIILPIFSLCFLYFWKPQGHFLVGNFLQKNLGRIQQKQPDATSSKTWERGTKSGKKSVSCHSCLVVFRSPALWKMMEVVTWDDDIHNMMEKIKSVPHHQPDRGVKTIMRRPGMLRNFGSKSDIEHFCRSIDADG